MAGKLVWLDAEMTGLDPQDDVLLEIAVIVTETHDLTPLATYHTYVHQPLSRCALAVPVVREMHTRSGLWDRVLAADPARDVAVIDAELLAFATRHVGSSEGYLAGNSVWQDRRFLDIAMPRFTAYLHHRILDVSSLKLAASFWIGPRAVPQKQERHTALEDIRESIAEYEHYRRLFLHGIWDDDAQRGGAR